MRDFVLPIFTIDETLILGYFLVARRIYPDLFLDTNFVKKLNNICSILFNNKQDKNIDLEMKHMPNTNLSKSGYKIFISVQKVLPL